MPGLRARLAGPVQELLSFAYLGMRMPGAELSSLSRQLVQKGLGAALELITRDSKASSPATQGVLDLHHAAKAAQQEQLVFEVWIPGAELAGVLDFHAQVGFHGLRRWASMSLPLLGIGEQS